jgi:hypothetical protein
MRVMAMRPRPQVGGAGGGGLLACLANIIARPYLAVKKNVADGSYFVANGMSGTMCHIF